MRAYQWNLDGAKCKVYELVHLVMAIMAEIIILNETHLTDDDKIEIPDYVTYYCNRIAPQPRPTNFVASGGTAILIHKSITISPEIFEYRTPFSEWLGVKVLGKRGSELIVATGYRSPKETLDLSFLDMIMAEANGVTPCIFAGDLNAWHPDILTGGDGSSNPTGITLSTWLSEQGHLVLNDGTPTHFSHRGVGRCIDHWICNSAALDVVSNAPEVLSGKGSDHRPTLLTTSFTTTTGAPRNESSENRFNWNCANLEAFEAKVEAHLHRLADPVKPNEGDHVSAIEVYEEAIVKAMTAAIVEIVPQCPANKINPWKLTKDIGDALDARNRLQRLHEHSPCSPVKTAINRATARIRLLIGAEKSKENLRYLQHLADRFHEQSTKRAWDLAARFFGTRRRNRTMAPLTIGNGRLITDDGEKARLLAKTFGKVVQGAPVTSNSPEMLNFWAETDALVNDNEAFRPHHVISKSTIRITDY